MNIEITVKGTQEGFIFIKKEIEEIESLVDAQLELTKSDFENKELNRTKEIFNVIKNQMNTIIKDEQNENKIKENLIFANAVVTVFKEQLKNHRELIERILNK